MKALLVSTPVMAHLNPLLSIGRILVSARAWPEMVRQASGPH
jgi:hypothetical protein